MNMVLNGQNELDCSELERLAARDRLPTLATTNAATEQRLDALDEELSQMKRLASQARCVSGGEVEKMRERDQALQRQEIAELSERNRRTTGEIRGLRKWQASRKLRAEFDGDVDQFLSFLKKVSSGLYPDDFGLLSD